MSKPTETEKRPLGRKLGHSKKMRSLAWTFPTWLTNIVNHADGLSLEVKVKSRVDFFIFLVAFSSILGKSIENF